MNEDPAWSKSGESATYTVTIERIEDAWAHFEPGEQPLNSARLERLRHVLVWGEPKVGDQFLLNWYRRCWVDGMGASCQETCISYSVKTPTREHHALRYNLPLS